jgi:hypothetical protein
MHTIPITIILGALVIFVSKTDMDCLCVYNVQMICPGQWLADVSRTRYMVREKRSRKVYNYTRHARTPLHCT